MTERQEPHAFKPNMDGSWCMAHKSGGGVCGAPPGDGNHVTELAISVDAAAGEAPNELLAARMNLAKETLVSTGYFMAGQVGDDLAPRITELNAALRQEIEALKVERQETVDRLTQELASTQQVLEHWRAQCAVREGELYTVVASSRADTAILAAVEALVAPVGESDVNVPGGWIRGLISTLRGQMGGVELPRAGEESSD